MKSNLTLLYVEDDKFIRNNYVKIFQHYFTNVITTDNGNDALRLFNENKIDVGIFDISIPGINGLTLTSKIREIDEDIEIIIISAHSDRDKLLQALKLQLVTYLVKPVEHKELITTIENLLHKKSENFTIELLDNFTWDMQTKTLFYKDEIVKISKKEISIISILLKNQTIYLTACQIHEFLYDGEVTESEPCNSIVKVLSRFKKKLNKQFNNEEFFIENCYGLGYKILSNK